MKPRVTVIIPTYNRANYLPQTIASALDQTWSAVEVLVMDDSSTDGTAELMATYGPASRVRTIRHAKNVGMAANWKAGVAAIETEFYCLLNDDDLLDPRFVCELIQPMLENSNLVLSFCDHQVIDENGRALPEVTHQLGERHHRAALQTGILQDFGAAVALNRSLHISCTLFRSALAPAHFIDERSGGFACGWLFYECYRTGHDAWYVDAPLASYRVHPGNMLGNVQWDDYLAQGQIFWCERMLADALPSPLRQEVEQQTAEIYASYASAWLRQGRRKEAGRLFAKSFALRKSLKSFAGLWLSRGGPLGTSIMQAFWQYSKGLLRTQLRAACAGFSPMDLAPLPMIEAFR